MKNDMMIKKKGGTLLMAKRLSKAERLSKSPGAKLMTRKIEEILKKHPDGVNSLKAKETSEKVSNDTDNKCEIGTPKCEYQHTIDYVVSLLREEVDQLDRLNDELSEDSPVWPKFELHQSCFERLLEHALEEKKKINEIWGS